MNLTRCTAKLNLHAAFHHVSDEVPVGITGLNISFGIIRLMIQSRVASICVKDRNTWALAFQSAISFAISWRWKILYFIVQLMLTSFQRALFTERLLGAH